MEVCNYLFMRNWVAIRSKHKATRETCVTHLLDGEPSSTDAWSTQRFTCRHMHIQSLSYFIFFFISISLFHTHTHTQRYLWDGHICLQTLYLHIVRFDWQISLSMRCAQRPRGGSLCFRYFVLWLCCALENATFIVITLRSKCAVTSLCVVLITYRLRDSGFADLIHFIKHFPMQVIQDWCRVANTGKVNHRLNVPGTKTKRISQTLWQLWKTTLNLMMKTFFFLFPVLEDILKGLCVSFLMKCII